MNKQELIKTALEDMGLTPTIDGDGDIYFKYQRKSVYAILRDDEENFFQLMLPKIHVFDEEDRLVNLMACNKMNRKVKLATLSIPSSMDSVTVATDIVFTEETLGMLIERNLSALSAVRTKYYDMLREIQEEIEG